MLKNRFKVPEAHGQIFAVPLPGGEYVFCKILLDIAATKKRRLFPIGSPIKFHDHAVVVDLDSRVSPTPDYVPSPVLARGILVERKEIGNKWPIVGKESVDPKQVEFPEGLVGFDHPKGQSAFDCGEMRIPLPYTDYELLRVFTTACYIGARPASHFWVDCLRALGRDDQVPPDFFRMSLAQGDLRYSHHRVRVYEHLPFPMEMSYHEKQKQMGLNLDRLYE